MSTITGSVNIFGTITPFDSSDTYGTHHESYGIGGYRSVATIALRDAIPASRRVIGMMVNVYNDPTSTNNGLWILQSDLTSWNIFVTSGGGGAGSALVSIGTEPPSSPNAGQLWWKSDRGTMYVYYIDAVNNRAWMGITPTVNTAVNARATGPGGGVSVVSTAGTSFSDSSTVAQVITVPGTYILNPTVARTWEFVYSGTGNAVLVDGNNNTIVTLNSTLSQVEITYTGTDYYVYG